MHPDDIEEMNYQANAYSDYMWEAYGAEAHREAEQEYQASFWDSELECDIRDIPWVYEARHDGYAICCVETLVFAFCNVVDDCPF